jgi:hypothetical protein
MRYPHATYTRTEKPIALWSRDGLPPKSYFAIACVDPVLKEGEHLIKRSESRSDSGCCILGSIVF